MQYAPADLDLLLAALPAVQPGKVLVLPDFGQTLGRIPRSGGQTKKQTNDSDL
jgi:hypothetical protein